MYRKAKKGSKISNPGMLSTSLDRKAAEGFASYGGGPSRSFEPYLLEINVPAGTRAIYMEEIPTIDDEDVDKTAGEEELLFTAGAEMTVDSRRIEKYVDWRGKNRSRMVIHATCSKC